MKQSTNDLYQPSVFGGNISQASEINAASDAYTIIKEACRNKSTQIAFLSGTINPISANNFANYVNSSLGRRVEVVKTSSNDPEARNKTQLKIIADDAIRNDEEIVNRIIRWVNNREYGNAVIYFSKARIVKILEKVISKLNQTNLDDITQRGKHIDENKQREIEEYIQALKLLGKSKEEINNAVKTFVRNKYPETQKATIERIKGIPAASEIQNKLAREAVSHGIGFIFTQDKDDKGSRFEPMSEKDKLIIADLFSNQKIFVLLATPAIGIGVNVSIRNMYLPTLYKQENVGGTFNMSKELINVRELTQLINRAGRKASIPIAGIYTPEEFKDYLSNVIKMTNDDFNEVPAIAFDGKNIKEDKFLRYFILMSNVAANSKVGQEVITRMNNTPATRHVSGVIRNVFHYLYNIGIKSDQEEAEINKATQDILKKIQNINILTRTIDNIKIRIKSFKYSNSLINDANEITSIDSLLRTNIENLTTEINHLNDIISDPARLNAYLLGGQNQDIFALRTRLLNIRTNLENEIIINKERTLQIIDEVENQIRDLEAKNDPRTSLMISQLKNIKSKLETHTEKQKLVNELKYKINTIRTEIGQLKTEIQNLRNQGPTIAIFTPQILRNQILDIENLIKEKEKQIQLITNTIRILRIKYNLI